MDVDTVADMLEGCTIAASQEICASPFHHSTHHSQVVGSKSECLSHMLVSPTSDAVCRRWERENRRVMPPPVPTAHAALFESAMSRMDWEPTEAKVAHPSRLSEKPKPVASCWKQTVTVPKPQAQAVAPKGFMAPKPSMPFEATEIDPWMLMPDLDMPHSAQKANSFEYEAQVKHAQHAAKTMKYPGTPRGSLHMTLFHNPQVDLFANRNSARPWIQHVDDPFV